MINFRILGSDFFCLFWVCDLLVFAITCNGVFERLLYWFFQTYAADGRFTFTSHTAGEHVICLHSNSTAWFSSGQLVRQNPNSSDKVCLCKSYTMSYLKRTHKLGLWRFGCLISTHKLGLWRSGCLFSTHKLGSWRVGCLWSTKSKFHLHHNPWKGFAFLIHNIFNSISNLKLGRICF